nr:RNA-directed DNA polymerase, eukaryota [Tanacetum cinerariifolium]
MKSISHMDVKSIWGNSNYQFVVSGSISNSGGILCVWEESLFKKVGVSISDNFIALYGIWLPTNSKILIVVIYAPRSFALKRILWDYISGLINRWNGETIVLGDFNKVRCEEERFGSLSYQSCTREFNHFISSSGLLEVKMEGYSFTWSHPTATKMSKLDRFLVSEDHHEVNQGDPSPGKGSSSKLYPKASCFSQDPHGNDSSTVFSTHVHSRSNPKGGSILDVLDGMIKVGRSMGYEMDGCSKDIEYTIVSQGVDDGFK